MSNVLLCLATRLGLTLDDIQKTKMKTNRWQRDAPSEKIPSLCFGGIVRVTRRRKNGGGVLICCVFSQNKSILLKCHQCDLQMFPLNGEGGEDFIRTTFTFVCYEKWLLYFSVYFSHVKKNVWSPAILNRNELMMGPCM